MQKGLKTRMKFENNNTVTYQLGNTTVIYSTKNDITSFTCVPNTKSSDVRLEKLLKQFVDKKYTHLSVEPMVQIALVGDMCKRDLSAGITMHDAYTALNMRAYDQKLETMHKGKIITTYLHDDKGIEVKHIVEHTNGYDVLKVNTEIANTSDESIILEMLSSFVLSNISPFKNENDTDKLILHRLQNYWSGEGRKESLPLAHFNMEDSWSSFGVRTQRIGQVGSMPARGYMPFAAIEDLENNVTWAVQMQAPDSWQIETIEKDGAIGIFGGHADHLYGHWRKNIDKGQSFATRSAYITVAQGGLTQACANLTTYHDTLLTFPESEEDLPVLYNEYLYSWGHPEISMLIPQMECAKNLGVDYFVVDAGWFEGSWDNQLGDWNANKTRFPNGLEGLKKEIDKYGLLGGVWYEFESVTDSSEIYKTHKDWLLRRDGKIINHYGRMFLDFRKPEVIEYLSDKVIKALKTSGLRYMKIDYNENIGIGTDGAESFGEGLRQHIECVVDFYKKIRHEIPDLVMEVCSSGGMRHEPVFMTLGSMVSFSDAHEGPEGAIIAMDLHRYMQPRIMQIWACIKQEYSQNDIYFTLVKSMLGRVCLSGNLNILDEKSKTIIKNAVEYYQTIKPIIKSGKTVLIDTDELRSLRQLNGTAKLVRMSNDGKKMLCYAFSFNQPLLTVKFDTAGYKLISSFGDGQALSDAIITSGSRWSGTVMLLEKK